jgi:antirestriction protein ArdC
VPWKKSWHTVAPKNVTSGKEYRGVNVLLLQTAPYESGWWLTFKQAQELGGTVRRGERATPVVYYRAYGDECTEDTSETPRRRFVLRYYSLFAVEQCEGIAAPPSPARAPFDPIEVCERIVSGYPSPPSIEHGGDVACYVPSLDLVKMPRRESFTSPPEYYSTILHELVHSSGAAHRLARKGIVDHARFASHAYSIEELVAEVGAAFLCAHGAVAPKTIGNSAAYIAHWSRSLRSNERWLVEASSQAARAADLILGRAAQTSAAVPQQAA